MPEHHKDKPNSIVDCKNGHTMYALNTAKEATCGLYQDLKPKISNQKHRYIPLASATVPSVNSAASFTSA